MTEGKEHLVERALSVEEETAIANEALEQIWDILEGLSIVQRLAVCTMLKNLLPDLDMAIAAIINRSGGERFGG